MIMHDRENCRTQMKGQWRFQRRHRPPELQCRGRSPSASGDGGQARAGGPNPTLANRTQ